jgi:hypothetical protein
VCSIRCCAKLEEWLAVLNAFLCCWNRVANCCPFAPHAFPQSGHVNLYTPDCECMSDVCALTVFVVVSPECNLTLVLLNRLVMKVVSLPMYVYVAHFCVGICVCVAAVCALVTLGGACRLGDSRGGGLGKHCYTGCSGW